MSSLKEFSLFSSLPLEIRQTIWHYLLPGPRALLITRNTDQYQASRSLAKRLFSISKHRSSARSSSKYAIAKASYGGKQPAALSVNRESRAEALRHLTPLVGIYWNLAIDVPYFELAGDNISDELGVTLLQEMRLSGQLDIFQGIAVSWALWEKYRQLMVQDGVLSKDHHPFTRNIRSTNIKSCTFVHMIKNKKEDVVNLGLSWSLVPYKMKTDALTMRVKQTREELEELELEIRYMTINGREKMGFSYNEYIRHEAARGKGNFDWFG